jgi:2-polyprenyl-3-methyl-5-hydroxy-6-metoxy-1,4-benzoquinol methylase
MADLTNADVINAYTNVPQHMIEGFGDEGDLTRQYLLNPALFELLGDVRDTLILDAGCGQGYLARLLARRGARVTGLEPSAGFYRYAVQREQTEQLGIHYVQADLSTWEPPASTFQTVIANMVLMDIPDYAPALQNCVLALQPAGKLIVSTLHPCFEEPGSAWKGQGYVAVWDYFTERAIPQTYGAFIHRPLSTYLNSIIRAGCVIDQVLEPQLAPAIAAQHDAERYAFVPGYLVIAATKPHAATASPKGVTRYGNE